jgi:hypothetical protein
VNTPWLRISTAGERLPRSVSTIPTPISSPPIRANGPDRDVAAELVGHRRQHAGDRPAVRRPRGRVGAVGVRDAADRGHRPVDVGVRGGVARRLRAIALDDVAVQVDDDHRLRVSSS